MPVFKDIHGPEWPLGFIKVSTPGTPVGIMSVVEGANGVNSANYFGPGASPGTAEYSARATQMIVQGVKPGGSNVGLVPNANNVYLVRAGGNKNDYGSVIAHIGPGNTFTIPSGVTGWSFNPNRYFIDADTANDGAIVTLIVGV